MFMVILCCANSTSAEDRATPLCVVGDSEHVWIYRTIPKDGTGPGKVTFTYGQSSDTGLRFRKFQGDPFGGFIPACAIRGENLHAFYRDGSHYRLRFVKRILSEPPGDDDFREITAPGGDVPKAISGDIESNSIYAIVATKSALQLPLHEQPAADSTPDASTNGTAEAPIKPTRITAAAIIDSDEPHAQLSLVRYHRGEWQFVTLCPESIQQATATWLATNRNEFAILYSPGDADKNLMITAGSSKGWQPPAPGPKLSPAGVLNFFYDQSVCTLLANEGADTSTIPDVRSYKWLDGVWKPGERMELSVDPSLEFGGSVAAGLYGREAVLAYELKSEGTSGVWAGVWPMAGGTPTAEPTEVRPLSQNSSSSTSSEITSIAIAVILSVLLFIVFVRRTPSLFVEMETPKGFALAGTGKRMLAFAVDLIAISIVAFPLFITPWITANLIPGENIQREFSYLLEIDPNAAYEPWTKCLLLYVVYSASMELACRATIGKLVVGLRVCSTTGSRGTSLAIIVRNCLRFELYYKMSFLPLAMLVILTRNHQRLGDLVAGTLVAEAVKKEQTQTTRA
ncbi:MAG: hypothetical protein DHS20C16_14240 [Phycisphaerae bacterium]|nr:MAG: hypothetical protein DHS20C16_14240 [Phycisphaerae bacterium]